MPALQRSLGSGPQLQRSLGSGLASAGHPQMKPSLPGPFHLSVVLQESQTTPPVKGLLHVVFLKSEAIQRRMLYRFIKKRDTCSLRPNVRTPLVCSVPYPMERSRQDLSVTEPGPKSCPVRHASASLAFEIQVEYPPPQIFCEYSH